MILKPKKFDEKKKIKVNKIIYIIIIANTLNFMKTTLYEF